MENFDSLQIKLEKARAQLPEETLNAINSVDWRAVIADMQGKSGFSIEQLGDLELETDILLSGLIKAEDYPKELEARMGISKTQAEGLVTEMNEKVFSKMKARLVESTERKKSIEASASEHERVIEDREELLRHIETPEPAVHPIFAQKLSGPVQVPATKTVHTLETPAQTPAAAPKPEPEAKPVPPPAKKYGVDPYRELPE